MFDLRRATPLLFASLTILGLSACSSSNKGAGRTSATKSTIAQASKETEQEQALKERFKGLSTPGAIAPNTVLAHVGSVPITFAAVKRQMLLLSPQVPLPDPPAYTACIARRKASRSAGSAAASEAALEASCQQSYEQTFQSALSATIHTQWLYGEAAEEGIEVSRNEVQKEFEIAKRQFRSEAEFAGYRKSTGQSIADMRSEIKLNKLSDGIFKNIKDKEHAPSGAQIAAYYQAHKSQYLLPEGRALRIARAITEVSALRIKQELQSGTSFASVAKELSPTIAQPTTSKDGAIKDLLPHVFEEKTLNDAIFAAQPHRLYGPVRVSSVRKTIAPEANSGFFLFEVTRTVPGRQIPLSRVEAQIAEALAAREKERVLAGTIARIKAKWRARTVCASGFVVKNCSQYKSNARGISGDPYTL
jgi:foldase protein PrsA